MTERFDTVVIGGGQAGLAISYYLTQQDREHVILEKQRIAESWRSRRWDSFTLVTPNWSLQLPGFEYDGQNPDGFLTKNEVVQYLEAYARRFNPPVRLGVEATCVEGKNGASGERLVVQTNEGALEASNVIVATGLFQKPKIPAFSQQISPEIQQMHSSQFRNTRELPPGAILVVGSGQSGAQIAEELYQSGRKVYLSTGSAGRVPRRYRGKDTTWWMEKMGLGDKTVDSLPSPDARFKGNPHVSGKEGGRTLNLHQFARDGVTLLGRLEGARGSRVSVAPDLVENLSKADKFAAELKEGIDKFIEKSGIEAPEENQPELRDGYEAEVITELDLESAGVKTVIWATGYAFDFSWVEFPIFDEFGYPVQQRGVTEVPGLYFLGLHGLYKIKSGLLSGVGDDAAHIAEHIEARMEAVGRAQ